MRSESETLGRGVFLDLETVDPGDLDRSRLAACVPEWDWHRFSEASDVPDRIARANVLSIHCPLTDETRNLVARAELASMKRDDIPNLLLTPHNAWASQQARQAALDQLADIIRAFATGRPFNVVE